MATTVPNNPYNTQQPKPLYTGLSKTSSAQDIASAYGQFASGAGGDTQGNRDEAMNYLRGLGIDQPTMDTAYGIYKRPPASSSTSTGTNTSTSTSTSSRVPSNTGLSAGTSTASGGVVSNAMQPTYGSATAAGYSPTTRQINKPTDTVQGQMESILATDSPLMQRARTIAKQGMAQRGLVNSSMSQGAGVAAMIDRATPIASQDANAYNQTASENMSAVNMAGQFNAGETNKFGLQRNDQTFTAGENAAQRSFTSGENAADRAAQLRIAETNIRAQENLQTAQQTFTAAQNSLDRDQQVAITKLNNDFNNASTSKTFAANLALATSSAVNAIATDPNLNPDSKRVAIQNAVDNANSTMQWGSTFYNTPLPTIAAPSSTASTLNPGGSYKPTTPSKPAWQEYLDANPDVAKAYGYNQEGALEHYRQFGRTEPRSGVTDALKAAL
jgi:hypothetical protein